MCTCSTKSIICVFLELTQIFYNVPFQRNKKYHYFNLYNLALSLIVSNQVVAPEMNFEGFKSLIQRVASEWWALARREIIEIDPVKRYLADSPFNAKETPENAAAYERLMDSRCKLFVSPLCYTT